MAASNGDQLKRPDNKAVPLKWPIKRDDYELLEVVGNFVNDYDCYVHVMIVNV